MREATFGTPCAFAMDETDPVAGPQLLISDSTRNRIRSFHLRTAQVTTVAGDSTSGAHIDGVACDARFYAPRGLAVAPSGVILVDTVHLPVSVHHATHRRD
jgi:hypothetical protein